MVAGSGIEHFARIVSPCNWERVYLPMMTVCFDASCKEEDPAWLWPGSPVWWESGQNLIACGRSD